MAINLAKYIFDIDDKLKDIFTNEVSTKRQIAVEKDISYAQDDICKLDIYYPQEWQVQPNSEQENATAEPQEKPNVEQKESSNSALESETKDEFDIEKKSNQSDELNAQLNKEQCKEPKNEPQEKQNDEQKVEPQIDKTQPKHPVLFNIHGGAWVTGDKHWRRGQGFIFSDFGLYVISPNYGLCPQYRYHQGVQHLFLALKWITENAEKYNFDLDNVYVSGDSAGAQLACLLAATVGNNDFRKQLEIPDFHLAIKGGILICGAYDISKAVSHIFSDAIVEDMTGYKKSDIEQYPYYECLKPTDWIDEKFPDNMFVAYGGRDMFVGGHEKLLFSRLDEFGKHYCAYRAGGSGEHCFHLFYKHKISRVFYDMAEQYFEQMLSGDLPLHIEEKTI
ncbi:MAG: alpha/beta hydrolase fold domain-containing protein [Clostridia bacterium]